MELAAEMAPAIGAGFVNPLITAGWAARAAAASPRLAGATAYGLGRASALPGVRAIPKGVEFAERYATPAARAANVINNGQEPRKRGGFFSRSS